jgi:hypothetical protein
VNQRAPGIRSPSTRTSSHQRLFELGQDLEQVAHQAEIGRLEDRRIAVLVDRHDAAGVLDARHVLDRAGDADREIQVRRDDLAGLADLHVVGHVARVHGGAARADRGAERSARLKMSSKFSLLPSAAAAGDDAGARSAGPAGRRRRCPHRPM